MSDKWITYYRRGLLERRSARRVVLIDGFSANGPDGGALYPWLSVTDCRKDAAAQGKRARFAEVKR